MRRTILFFLSTLYCILLSGQVESFDALKADYPKLMKKFGDELNGQKADYIFAIDVSGTMNKYKEIVVPALGEFFRSLQEGDYVSIIKFGGEATNEVGSAGKISAETITNLINYAGHVYDTPTTAYEKEKYFKWTDLDNMLRYLADDMQQIDRSRLKFVFIITDFLHDPSPSRKGHEDWDGIARRFATEQSGNDVYVFALQLPGSGRDLEKVRRVFPKRFNFNHVPITNGSALSAWFTQRKNAILLDKLYALIAHKIEPADFQIDPSLDINGRVKLGVSWKSNPVYNCLRVDEVSTSASGFEFNPNLPKKTKDEVDVLDAGKLSLHKTSFMEPKFKKVSGELEAKAGFEVPYQDELAKLGFEAPVIQASASVSRMVFCYPVPFWLFCLIIFLILLYIFLFIKAVIRNRSKFYRINGVFEICDAKGPVAPSETANAAGMVDFGAGAGFISVPDCDWCIRIKVKKYPAFLLFKAPEYIVQMTMGDEFEVNGGTWLRMHTPAIQRYSHIYIGKYTIYWQAQ